MELIDIFFVKVLILTISQFVMTNDIMLELFDRTERERESIEHAYVRYVHG